MGVDYDSIPTNPFLLNMFSTSGILIVKDIPGCQTFAAQSGVAGMNITMQATCVGSGLTTCVKQENLSEQIARGSYFGREQFMNDDNNLILIHILLRAHEATPGSSPQPPPETLPNWFLDYASYVVLERAIPALEDGLKPVQRRILHAMKEMDDGRFHKVANVIGQTMQYHPHGDAAIGDALVHLGQKELLLQTQGNWGDTRTGDAAAAPRYIETQLSKFALEVAFHPDITQWQLSYDGAE